MKNCYFLSRRSKSLFENFVIWFSYFMNMKLTRLVQNDSTRIIKMKVFVFFYHIQLFFALEHPWSNERSPFCVFLKVSEQALYVCLYILIICLARIHQISCFFFDQFMGANFYFLAKETRAFGAISSTHNFFTSCGSEMGAKEICFCNNFWVTKNVRRIWNNTYTYEYVNLFQKP